MACSNSTGTHKLPLMFVGKSLNPRCFKHVSLPVKYYSQKNAWVDTNIFTDWFKKHFVPSVKKHLTESGLPIKALLLLDNAPAHPDVSVLQSENGNIKAMYLPPNTTAIIQPMDQGVLEALKRRYKRANTTETAIRRRRREVCDRLCKEHQHQRCRIYVCCCLG